MEASFGKMPTTSVRRLSSPLSRYSGLVTGMRVLGADVPAATVTVSAYGATVRDRGTGSTKVRAGRCTR